MDIDIYQQCPCQSGKKIKFCCAKEIVNDLNVILKKNRAGQSQAALDQIDRVIKKSGPRDSLLTIQTHILISTNQIEKAKQVNQQFLSHKPKHPTALHHKSLISLADGDIGQAVHDLQDAMDSITGNEIPISFGNVFQIVGLANLNAGRPIAALAHLKFAAFLRGEDHPEISEILIRFFSSREIPIVAKQEFHLDRPIEGVPWHKKYLNAHRALDRGQFRKALKFLEKIEADFPGQRIVLRAIAIVHGFLGDHDKAIAAWREFAKLQGIPKLEAIEAELIALTLDPTRFSNPLSIFRRTSEIKDLDRVQENALSNPRLIRLQELSVDPFDEGPAPKFVFGLLDGEGLTPEDEISADVIPEFVGELFIYGKQTDRPARLETIVSEGRESTICEELLESLFGEFLEGEPKVTQIDETTDIANLLDFNFQIPSFLPATKGTELLIEKIQETILERWTEVCIPALGGKSAREAASHPEYENLVYGLVLLIEASLANGLLDLNLFNLLTKKLQLGELGTYSHPEDGIVSSPILQQFLDPAELSDKQLLGVREIAMKMVNVPNLKKILPEVLKRDTIDIPKDIHYWALSQIASDNDEAFEYLEKAKEYAAKTEGRSVGICLVQELDLKIMRGQTESVGAILSEIQTKHLHEPNVEYQLVRVLDKYGVGPEQGPIRQRASSMPASPIAAPSSADQPVWSPQAPTEQKSAESAQAESKLWLPDS
ncbi:MAG: hypothetical protein AAF623_10445 [Planctomycetota bacterium]